MHPREVECLVVGLYEARHGIGPAPPVTLMARHSVGVGVAAFVAATEAELTMADGNREMPL